MGSHARRLPLVAIVVLIGVSLATPVAAHGNYLTLDSQVSTDGTVRVEGVSMITTGWVVLHADRAGELGRVIGHAAPQEPGFNSNLTVAINSTYWGNVTGTTTVWTVLHYDENNDGEFDPASDPPIGGSDSPEHALRIKVEKGNEPAFVMAERDTPEETAENAVTIRRVRLPEDGYLVIRADSDGEPGEIVGNRSLAAGGHEAVTVDVAEHFYHHQPEKFDLWAVVYRGDGDGVFDADDEPVTVNGSPVASRFEVRRTGEDVADHTHTRTVTRTPSPTTTPTDTAHEHDHEHDHEEGATASPTQEPSTPTGTPAPTSTPGQPGLGFLVAVVAILLCGRYSGELSARGPGSQREG